MLTAKAIYGDSLIWTIISRLVLSGGFYADHQHVLRYSYLDVFSR